MAQVKAYSTVNHSAEELINYVIQFLSTAKNMETQRFDHDDGHYSIVQARAKAGVAKKLIGMDKAVTLRFTKNENSVNVELSEAKWGDKAAVMAVSMFFLWPLAVTSGAGIYQQKKLFSDLISAMDSYMAGLL